MFTALCCSACREQFLLTPDVAPPLTCTHCRAAIPDPVLVHAVAGLLWRDGWAVDEAPFGDTWAVSGSRGSRLLVACAGTRAEAWRRAWAQAERVPIPAARR